MRTATKAYVRRIITWLRETWAEMDYAQRRMIELQMGIPSPRMPADRSNIDTLEATYSLPTREPDHGLD